MKVVIVGVGTAAMIVADTLLESHNFILAGFIGTKEEKDSLYRSILYRDMPFLGDHSVLPKMKEGGVTGFIVAIGDNQIREERFYEGIQAGLTPINVVSKYSMVNSNVTLGKGIAISPGVVLSHGVILGNNIIIGPSAVVNVNSVIGDNCYLYPGVIVSGRCNIEKNVTLGAGVVVESAVKIGKNNKIPAGDVVRQDVEGIYRKEF